jgi:hypothetical protein
MRQLVVALGDLGPQNVSHLCVEAIEVLRTKHKFRYNLSGVVNRRFIGDDSMKLATL